MSLPVIKDSSEALTTGSVCLLFAVSYSFNIILGNTQVSTEALPHVGYLTGYKTKERCDIRLTLKNDGFLNRRCCKVSNRV